MHKKEVKPKFNTEAVKNMTREVFIESHKKAYPDLNLGKEHDKIVGKEVKETTAK